MKVLVCLGLFFGISQGSQHYFSQTAKWMAEIEKNKDKTLKNLASIDFHLTRDMIANATMQFLEYSEKQGYNTDINNQDCFAQLSAWVQALQAGQLWAIEVIDALGKLNSGLARGNFRSMGHYRQCVEIFQPLSPEQGTSYQGKYCLVPMTSGFHELENAFPPADGQAPFPIGDLLPDGLWLDFGFCIPATCNGTRLGDLLGFIGLFLKMRPATIFQQNEELFCSHTNLPPLTWFEWVALGLILGGFALMILTTVVDMVATKLDVRISPATVAMSVYSNGRKLFSLRKNKEHIQCLYGIRALALIWLLFGYRHFLSVVLPLINTLDFVLDFATGYFSPWVTSSLLALDAILLLNGVHIAYVFFNKMQKDGRVSIFKMYVHRYLKVTPYVAILILLLLTLTKYSNDGPYFTLITETQRPACETYFWSAVLHVQNYVNPDNICILHTFLLSVDMQLFWASPLLLFPLFFWGPMVTVFVLVLSALAVGCAFATSWFNRYSALLIRMFVDPEKLANFMRQIFFATHIRMSSWLIGIFVGYCLWKVKGKRSPIPWAVETILWILSFSGIIAVIYWIYPFQQAIVEPGSGIEFIRGDDLQNALYIAFARYIFALSLGWIIYGCQTGSGLFINWFFSLAFWMPFARMGLAIYLVSLSAQIVIIASQKTPYVFDSLETWHAFNGDLVIVLIFAALTYLLLEAPLMVLEKSIYDLYHKLTNPKSKKTVMPGTFGYQEEPEIIKPPPNRSWF